MTRPSDSPILLIDDNPMDIDLTLRAFARRNITNPILVARDGAEALEWVQRWEAGEPLPVLILLDLKLPRIDGLDVLRAFKGHPAVSSIPVVVITTSSEDSDIRNAYYLGANSYLVKPADFDKFLQLVEQIELYWILLNEPPR
jgi:hypothetical protein